jgi:hypothetical protein
MNAGGTRRDWAWAAVGAVGLVAAVLLLLRAPRAPATEKPQRSVSVSLGTDPALRDEAAMFDPTPLFLPTKNFNASPKDIELREPGSSAFPNYPPKLGFAETELKLDSLSLPKPVQVPPSPASAPGAVLAWPAPGVLALGFGRTDGPVATLPARGAFVEVFDAKTGRRLLPKELPETARPPGGGRPWQPMEFIAAVDAAGLVGPLVPTVRSGVEEVDSFFQNYLARTLRVGERLAPGFYRICVGP